jgi:hypothetical protein
VSLRDAAPPRLWIVRPRLPTYVSSYQPTVIFLGEAGDRHLARQGADEKGPPGEGRRPQEVGTNPPALIAGGPASKLMKLCIIAIRSFFGLPPCRRRRSAAGIAAPFRLGRRPMRWRR